MRRTHVRGKTGVHNDIGIMLMSMNLTKLACEARRRVTALYQNSFKNKKHREIIKIVIIVIVLLYLRLVLSQPPFFYTI